MKGDQLPCRRWWVRVAAVVFGMAVWGGATDNSTAAADVDMGTALMVGSLEDVSAQAPYIHLRLLDRNLDMSSRVLRETIAYHITARADTPTPITALYITNTLDAVKRQHLLKAAVSSKSHSTDELQIAEIRYVPAMPQFLKLIHHLHPLPTDMSGHLSVAGAVIKLSRALHSGEEVVLLTAFARSHAYTPVKPHIAIHDDHRVYVDVPVVYQSAYAADQQWLSITHHTDAKIEIPAAEFETDATGDAVRLPQRVNVTAYTSGAGDSAVPSSYRVFLTLKSNLGYFKKMQRHIVLSNFGTVQVREEHDFVNEASALNSEFSRAALSKMSSHQFGSLPPSQRVEPSHVALHIPAVLPRTAYGLQFYDIIGNVSTSFVSEMDQYIVWNLWPRFPILGGWTANWSIEYHVPANMMTDPGTKLHAIKLLSLPPVPDTCADELEVRVVLPSGAYNGNVVLPREHYVVASRKEQHWGWLDILQPREVHVLQLRNVCSPRDYVLNAEALIFYEGGGMYKEYVKTIVLLGLLAIVAVLIFGLFRFLWHGTRLPSLEERSIAQAAEYLLEVIEGAIMDNRKYLEIANSPSTDDDKRAALLEHFNKNTNKQRQEIAKIHNAHPDVFTVLPSFENLQAMCCKLMTTSCSSPSSPRSTTDTSSPPSASMKSMRSSMVALEHSLVLAAARYESRVTTSPQFLWNKKQT